MPAPNPAFDPLRAAGVRAEAPQGRFMLITAPAKINLYLGVHGQTYEEGYHGVDTVMTTLDIADTLAIAPSDRLMVKTVPEADFPQESNSAYKAAVAMGEAFGREPNFAILIDKHIPSAPAWAARPPMPLQPSWASAVTGASIRAMSASMRWRARSAQTFRSSSTARQRTSMVAAIRCARCSDLSPAPRLRWSSP